MDLQRIRLEQHFLLWCTMTVLTLKSVESAVVTPVHRICHSATLNSALQCAYIAFLPLLSEEIGLEHLKQSYPRLPEEVERKNYSGKDKNFMESTGDVSVSKIDEFFHRAVEHCLSTDSRHQDLEDPLRTEDRIPSTGQFSFVVRIPFRASCNLARKLANLCLALFAKRRRSRIEAFRICFPRLRAEKTPRKKKPATSRLISYMHYRRGVNRLRSYPRCNIIFPAIPGESSASKTPEAEETPHPVCEEETLQSASECACKVYKEAYSKYVRWALDDICDEAFGNVTLSTSRSCKRFAESQNPGVPFNESLLDDYIDEACETCSIFDATKNFVCLSTVGNVPRLQHDFLYRKVTMYCLLQAARSDFPPKRCLMKRRELIDLQQSLKSNESDEDIKPNYRQSSRTFFSLVKTK